MTRPFFRLVPAFFAVAAAVFTTQQGCSSDPAACDQTLVNGVCRETCTDAKCHPGNKCVASTSEPQGQCLAECTSAVDCAAGSACSRVDKTMSGDTGLSFCVSLNLPSKGGEGASCTDDSVCDVGHGFSCKAGTCAKAADCVSSNCPAGQTCGANGCEPSKPAACSTSADCQTGQQCRGTGVMGATACIPGPSLVAPGQYGTSCPFGTECDTAGGFACVGLKNDASAYCTKSDGCSADNECPSGYWCGALATRNADGNTLIGQDKRACLRAAFCSPCSSDVDCSGKPGALCVTDKDGEGFCSLPCEAGKNSCIFGAECADVGGGQNACRPITGACHAKPSDPSAGCEPCRINSDCGADGLCVSGDQGYKPGVRFCAVKCGPPDAFGKGTCPLAPNGQEMVCLDENNFSSALGGPFGPTDPATGKPFVLYGYCYAPFTSDNSSKYGSTPAPRGVCGNLVRDPGEECDDGNTSDNDGCGKDCKVTAKCRFTVKEPNDDAHSDVFTSTGASLSEIVSTPTGTDPTAAKSCYTFAIEGELADANDIDVARFRLADGYTATIDTFVGGLDKCTNADLVAEARAGATLADLDTTVPCGKLSTATKNLDDSKATTLDQVLCPTQAGVPAHLGCGSCTHPGVCGACDDDNGIGDCARLVVSTTLSVTLNVQGQGAVSYPVTFESADKYLRLYARKPLAQPASYLVIVQRLRQDFSTGQAVNPPILACY